MSHSSEIAEHIERRRRMAAYAAEIIARSRELLAYSRALLEKKPPTAFLGESHHLVSPDPIALPDGGRGQQRRQA